MGLHQEITEQPQVIERLVETQKEAVGQIAQAIYRRQVDFVLLAARGTSDHAAVYAQYLWGAQNGLPVALAAPSLFSRYGASPRLSRALVVGISQSGQSPDVVEVIAAGRQQGALTLAITNAPDSELAQAAEFSLDIQAGCETAVAATKTYTAELAVLAALSAALSERAEDQDALQQVPTAMRAALGAEDRLRELAETHREMDRCVVLGRGYHYGSAQEWALKLKELAYVLADPYSAADFQHGPIAILEPGFPVLAIAPRGAVHADVFALLKRVKQEWGARLLVISDDPDAGALGGDNVIIPARLPEWLVPLVSILPAQLFCYHLALVKGYDVEAPRGLRKVTLTH